MKSSASTVTSQIIDYLLRLPECFAYRSNTLGVPLASGAFRPAPKRGVPDITGVFRGRAFYIEVKIGSDRLSEVQKSFILSVRHAGGIIMTVDSFSSFLSQFQAKADTLEDC